MFSFSLLCSANLQAQDAEEKKPFEGTLDFEYRLVILDTALRNSMEKSFEDISKAASSEANVKAMKAMEESMRSADMKAYFEQNPEIEQMMKDQLAMMKRQQQGPKAALDAMNTSKLSIQVKDSSSLFKLKGRQLISEMDYKSTLFDGEDKKFYYIDPVEKNYEEVVMNVDSADLVGSITRVSGDSVIFDIACQKYEFEIDSGEQKISGHMWLSPELKQLSSIWKDINGMGFFSQLDGFPLYMFLQSEQEKGQMFNMFMLRKATAEKIPADEVNVPSDYTEKKE